MAMGRSGFHAEMVCPQRQGFQMKSAVSMNTEPAIAYTPVLSPVVFVFKSQLVFFPVLKLVFSFLFHVRQVKVYSTL